VMIAACADAAGMGVLRERVAHATGPPLTAGHPEGLEIRETLKKPCFSRQGQRQSHTVLSASAGASRAARIAGSSPATAPISIAAAKPPAQAEAGITIAQPFVVA
jgi:hypothetical protein